MEEWKEYKLEDLCNGKGSYGIGASAVPFSKDKFTYLRITDINDDGTLNKSGLMSVADEDANKYILENNDIVFARTGNSTGRSYFYDGTDGTLVYAGFLIKFSLDEEKVNPRILKYYTHSKPYYDWVKSFDTGGTRGNINAKTYGALPISLPPRKVQDRIVEILKSLDDKIEVNRRINAELEELAQALFKSWFVDFEPFKDSEFVESELGMIPKGWKVGSISEICDVLSGFAFKSSSFVDEGNYRLITIKGVQDGYLEINGASYIDEIPSKMPNYCSLNIGDILLSLTGNVGRCCYVHREDLLLNQRVAKLYPKNCNDVSFVYTFFRKQDTKTSLELMARGTAQANLSPIETSKMKVVLPDRRALDEFGKICNPLFWILINNQQEITHLTALRDTLLPKLMSGEIDVNEVEI